MIEALHETEAKGAAALILLWMSQNADDGDLVSISVAKLAKKVKGQKDNVAHALRGLVEMGEVEVVEPARGRRPKVFRVINRIGRTPQVPAKALSEAPEKIKKTPVGVVKVEHNAAPRRLEVTGVRSVFRSTVTTLESFLDWCRSSKQGSVCIYHIGLVGADRINSPVLSKIADTAQILADGRFIMIGQHMVALPAGRQVAYTATRTGTGYAPRAVLSGAIGPQDFLALRIIRARSSDLSAARALRSGLGVSEGVAEIILRRLQSSGYIATRGFGTGWVLTDDASRMVAS